MTLLEKDTAEKKNSGLVLLWLCEWLLGTKLIGLENMFLYATENSNLKILFLVQFLTNSTELIHIPSIIAKAVSHAALLTLSEKKKK